MFLTAFTIVIAVFVISMSTYQAFIAPRPSRAIDTIYVDSVKPFNDSINYVS